jgi:hypothetical protein
MPQNLASRTDNMPKLPVFSMFFADFRPLLPQAGYFNIVTKF